MRAWLLVLLTFLVVDSSSVAAQKLESYRYSPQPARTLGIVCRHDQAAETIPPEGVALPQFKSAKPLFFRWTLGKDLTAYRKLKGGIAWIALDGSGAAGRYEKLYIDSDCDGSLADEQSIEADNSGAGGAPRFTMVQVLLPAESEPAPYHLNLQLNDSKGGKSLSLESACWNEGKVRIGSKEYKCILIDGNVNGQFNDIAPRPHDGDVMRFGPAEADSARGNLYGMGRYMEVEGAFYVLHVPPDGSSVTFTPAGDIPIGSLSVLSDMTELSLAGPQGHFYCKPIDGRVTVPEGSYLVFQWTMARKDDNGIEWTLAASGRDDAPMIQVKANEVIALDVGEPVISQVDVSKKGDRYVFNGRTSMRGRMGETVRISIEKGGCADLQLRITNADGTYDLRETFSTGFG